MNKRALTAAVATMRDAKAFKSGREFSTWLGLVSRQTGTGGGIGFWGLASAVTPICARY
jgi:transposase